mmetsp:Transcript_8052/g.18527  ORF Transcript_8052/g.18527 Transcript_8052/m.18527 type:complete len:276 (-) Transcript_8052:101-928(-)
MAHVCHRAVVELARGPVLPHLDLLRVVVVLLLHVIRVDRELKLGRARVLELVLVEEPEVGAHLGLVGVLPARIIEHDLARAIWAQVALVPVQQLIPHLLVVEPGALVPPAHRAWHVRSGEGVEEACDGHRQPDLASGHEELKADPGAHRVGPDDVRDPVGQLGVGNGQQLWGERVGADVLGLLEHLLAAWVVEGHDLHRVLVLLDKVGEGRVRRGVDGLGAAGVVEAEDAELRGGRGEAQDLVLHAVVQELPLHRLGIGLDLGLQCLVHLHGGRV